MMQFSSEHLEKLKERHEFVIYCIVSAKRRITTHAEDAGIKKLIEEKNSLSVQITALTEYLE